MKTLPFMLVLIAASSLSVATAQNRRPRIQNVTVRMSSLPAADPMLDLASFNSQLRSNNALEAEVAQLMFFSGNDYRTWRAARMRGPRPVVQIPATRADAVEYCNAHGGSMPTSIPEYTDSDFHGVQGCNLVWTSITTCAPNARGQLQLTRHQHAQFAANTTTSDPCRQALMRAGNPLRTAFLSARRSAAAGTPISLPALASLTSQSPIAPIVLGILEQWSAANQDRLVNIAIPSAQYIDVSATLTYR